MSDSANSSSNVLATEVLVIGGGPAGAATGYWLATLGHDVTVVERKTFPREKTCGDGLTPRAVYQLGEMGLTDQLSKYHRYHGLRATGMGKELELQWPSHSKYPSHGYVVRRRELDMMVADNAAAAGATLLTGHEALDPIVDRGFVRGATVQTKDGADARRSTPSTSWSPTARTAASAGRSARSAPASGRTAPRSARTGRRRATPIRGSRAALDVKDRNGNPMPGYGWIFPVGDGTVNIGVGLLSTFRDFKSVNTTHLLDAYAHQVAERWEIDPGNPECKATSGRIPMGGSVGPKAGPSYLVIGDAAGSVNPFNGEGIDYAYETARMAANVLHDALTANDPTALQQYPRLLDDEYGDYFKVARLFARVIGRPALMRELTRVGMSNRTLMEWVLRIMANLLRDDEFGPAEAAYKAAAKIVKLAPNA